MEELQKKLNYRFRDDRLPELALTHRSMGQETNERLEFLGDSILNAVISVYLYKQFPQIREGGNESNPLASRGQANFVGYRRLLKFWRSMSAMPKLSKRKLLDASRWRLLADALEAIIGAIYLGRRLGKVPRGRFLRFTNKN